MISTYLRRNLVRLYPTLSQRRTQRYLTTPSNAADFSVDNLIIGGGVVGLAVAENLTRQQPNFSTLLLEKNERIGEETSARNSEVIHAGIYYPPDSLKTRLCIRGKHLLYDLCTKYNIPHKQLGKWIVAQSDDQAAYLETMKAKSDDLNVPTRFLSQKEIKEGEPDVRAKAVLLSPTTGIIDTHELMAFLEGQITERGSDVVVNSTVTSIQHADSGKGGYIVTITDKTSSAASKILTTNIVNAAGLHADKVANLILPPSPLRKTYKIYYAKGHYYGYRPKSPRTSHLIYPVPEKNLAGLGTHLTLDLQGNIRFGPDVLYVDDPNDYGIVDEHVDDFFGAIQEYLPTLKKEGLYADYAGIRPKLSGPGEPFRDFVIKEESAEGLPGFVNLIGIESPGLTSSLAIAEMVHELLFEQ